MALEQDTRDELLMLSTALTASLTTLAISKQVNPGLPGLMQRYAQLINKAEQELNKRGEPVLSARPSKFVKDIEFPLIVCLCGSTKFWKTFQEQGLRETLEGKVVLTIGSATAVDDDHVHRGAITEVQLGALYELHLKKIDLADEVLIINCDGYIGAHTQQELAYALAKNKRVRFLEPERGQVYLTLHQQELQDLGRRC